MESQIVPDDEVFEGLKWYEALLIKVLRQGPIPRHIAFIMDGSRRFARTRNMSVQLGHTHGLRGLMKVLNYLRAMGVREVTVYAFSIENFNRTPDEVTHLLTMFDQFLEDLLKKPYPAEVRLVGDITLLPAATQTKMRLVEEISSGKYNMIINVAFAYTSRDDITHSMRRLLGQVADGQLEPAAIDGDLIEQHMYTSRCSDVDMLVRTSGETRLSDFLLWEVSARDVNLHTGY